MARNKDSGETSGGRVGNPGNFHGRRLQLLLSFLPAYMARRGARKALAELWKEIRIAYFNEFPYHLRDGLNEPLVLAPELLYQLDKNARENALEEGMKQIKNFFYNQRTKEAAVTSNIWLDILTKGVAEQLAKSKPRREVDWRAYMRDRREEIAREADRRWDALSAEKREQSALIAIKASVGKEWFEAESEDFKKEFRQRLEADYKERQAEYELQQEKGEDQEGLTTDTMQKYRENIVSVIEPLLEVIVKLAGYTGASLIAAAPPEKEGGDYAVSSIHVGRSIRAKGSLKFNEWEPEKYDDVWVRHFLAWILLTSERLAGDDGEQPEVNHGSAEQNRGVDVEGPARPASDGAAQREGPPDATNDPAAATSASSSSTRRHARPHVHISTNVDDLELSDTETRPSPSPILDDSPEEHQEAPPASAGAETETAHPDDEEREALSIPKKDARGRVLSEALVARLKRMPRDERERLIKSLDRISDYEFAREHNIATHQLRLAELNLDDVNLFPEKSTSGSSSQQYNDTSRRNKPPRRETASRRAPGPPAHPEERRHSTRLQQRGARSSSSSLAPPETSAQAQRRENSPVDAGHDNQPLEADQSGVHESTPAHEHHASPSTSDQRGTRDGNLDVPDARRVDGGGADGGADMDVEPRDQPAEKSSAETHGHNSRAKRPSAVSGATEDDSQWSSREGWEPWVQKAMENIESLDGVEAGSEVDMTWKRVVRLWWDLERGEDFKGTSGLPHSRARPKYVGDWIARARSTKYAPPRPKKEAEVDDWKCDFKDSMWAWWSELNPQWRARDRSGKIKPKGAMGDLSQLRCTGQNGLLSVLKALKWLFDMEEVPNGSPGWRDLVGDVLWVLEGLNEQNRASNGGNRPNKRRKT